MEVLPIMSCEDQDLFHHRYTYVIFGNNELGEGGYSNKTFSYQRG